MKVSVFAPYGVFIKACSPEDLLLLIWPKCCVRIKVMTFSSSQNNSFNIPQFYEWWWGSQALYIYFFFHITWNNVCALWNVADLMLSKFPASKIQSLILDYIFLNTCYSKRKRFHLLIMVKKKKKEKVAGHWFFYDYYYYHYFWGCSENVKELCRVPLCSCFLKQKPRKI